MSALPSGPDRVVTYTSRPTEEGGRSFELEETSPPEATDLPDREGLPDQRELPDPGELPDPATLRHENELVAAMRERGWRLTMVGGGAGSEDLRRFYFRRG